MIWLWAISIEVVTLNLFHTCTSISPQLRLNTTAAYGAHFMIAHLHGRFGSRILEEEFWLMHRQFTHHPKLPGTAYGFHERLQNNMRMIEGSLGYSSSLTLLPTKILAFLQPTSVGCMENYSLGFRPLFSSSQKPALSNALTSVIAT